jgi:non-homologous end joining protein Ku
VPASRPYWNGYLKLSFVSCPVALYPAASAAERVSFRQVNRRTGHRLRHRLVDSITREDVPANDKARGYEVGENELLFVEDRDLAQARSERPKMTKSSAKRTNRKHRRRKLRRSRARRTPAQSRSSDLFRRGRSTRAISRNPTTLSRVGRSARNRSR